jgi:MFS family permease
MIGIDVLRAVLVLLIPLLHLLNMLTLSGLYLLVFLISLFSSVFGPALAASIPLLVSSDRLTPANALLQSTNNIGMLAGPAISGLGIALVGAHNVLFLNVGTFLVSALFLLPIQLRQPTGPRSIETATFREEVVTGFRFLGSHPMVRRLMFGASLYSMAASAVVFLLPALAESHFEMASVELGALWSLLGIGMLLGSLWLSTLTQQPVCGRLRLASASLILGAIAMAAMAFFKWKLLAMSLMVALGGSLALFNPITWAFLQELAPTVIMARVLTAFSTAAMAASMLGMLLFGWAADVFTHVKSLMGASLIFL